MLKLLSQLLNEETSRSGRITSIVLASLILGNVFAAIFETVPGLSPNVINFLNVFEFISMIIFTIEYVARVACSVVKDPSQHPIWGRIRFIFTPMALIDLIVLIPYYISGLDSRTLRILRLLRLVRLLRYEPYANSLRGFAQVLKERRGELMLCVMLAIGMILVTSTVMYHVEREVQPDEFGSIPSCLWWAVIHLTTIGYGDVYPITLAGRIVAGITAFIGVGFVTLPSSIFAMAYVDHLRQMREKKTVGSSE